MMMAEARPKPLRPKLPSPPYTCSSLQYFLALLSVSCIPNAECLSDQYKGLLRFEVHSAVGMLVFSQIRPNGLRFQLQSLYGRGISKIRSVDFGYEEDVAAVQEALLSLVSPTTNTTAHAPFPKQHY